jgi:hypothetical protein
VISHLLKVEDSKLVGFILCENGVGDYVLVLDGVKSSFLRLVSISLKRPLTFLNIFNSLNLTMRHFQALLLLVLARSIRCCISLDRDEYVKLDLLSLPVLLTDSKKSVDCF